MKPKYPILCGKIAERGIKKSAISKRLGISERCLTNKLSGKTEFTWNQACVIQSIFFPDIEKEKLFSERSSQSLSA